MQLVLLCGGVGSRLNSLNLNLPKVLVPIKGTPFLTYLIQSLPTCITKLHFCLGHYSDLVLDYLSTCPLPYTFSIENPSNLLGTFGALLYSIDYLDNTFLLQYGDTILSTDYNSFYQTFHRSGKHLGMTILPSSLSKESPNVYSHLASPGPSQTSYFYTTNSSFFNCTHIDYGLLAFAKSSLRYYCGHASLSTVQELATNHNNVFFQEVFSPYIEIGTPSSYLAAQGFL